jgi:opacity protein-like surface antigen
MTKRMLVAVAMFAAVASGAVAADLKDRMEFPASNGKVVFFHNNHVNEVHGACAVCHDTTPPGAIPGFGADYAHTFCLKCHADPNGPEGPTTCEACHKN